MTARDAATEADPTAEVAPDATATAGEGATDADADGATAEVGDTAPEGRRARRGGRRRREAAAPETDEAAVDPGAADPDPTDPDPTDPEGGGRAPRRRTVRLVTALFVVSALFAVAMGVLYVVHGRPAAVVGLSATQQAAVDAASQAAVNLQTFRRASFDQDFANAVASLTPQFAQQQLTPRKDALEKQLKDGGRDATATALSAGLLSSTSSQAVVLVVTNTTQKADDGTSTPFVFSRLQLTLQLTQGKWLVSDLKSVGLS